MRFRVLDAVSVGGDGHPYNEDTFGWSDVASWVIDGATSLDATRRWEQTSGRWIADEANKLMGSITPNAHLSAELLIREVVESLSDRWERLAGDNNALLPPVASLGMVRLRPNGLGAEVVTLGDCLVAHQSTRGSAAQVALDIDTVDLERARTARGGALRENGVEGLIEDRLRYIEGSRGSVLSLDPDIADRARIFPVTIGSGSLFLLASDGFSRVERLPRFGSWGEIVDAAYSEGLSALVEELRNQERADAAFSAFEHKGSDDATALLAIVRR